MRFALLGPVRVHGENGPLEIRGSLRRTLLAALLLGRGSVVSADRLSELLWGASRPAAATPLYNQVMRLRQALGDDGELIHAVPPGYLIRLDAHALDLDEFGGLCVQARDAAAAADWPRAAEMFADALAIWRGEILADVPALHNDPSIHQFAEDRLLALQGRIEADLNLARHDALIGELKTLTLSHPLREAFHAQLMLAFHRAGRQADALGVYRDLRHAIVTELGVEPGSAIRALHTKILNSDPALVLAPRAARTVVHVDTPGPATAPVPRQLPADTRVFEGRRNELDELADLALSTTDSGPAAGTVVISAINGMGGVGKTALAVRAAHRIRERFPDGQLFIDLHGYSADLDPVRPEDALDYLLRSLGVPPQSIPADVDERAAHYRSRLAGSRTLIVLDNAVNAAQVRPLLPAAPGCLVLITSRSRLTSLDDAHLLALDVLSPADAASLLRTAAGPSRAAEFARDAEAVAELVGLCGRLPLAIRIAAARLRLRDTLAVSALVAELREEPGRLDRLHDEERDLAVIFDSSLRVLPGETRRLFRLLGLAPGPDFDAYAAAHLAATDLRTAERALDSLLDYSLLIQHASGRYRFHDLVRAHARDLAAKDPDSPGAFNRLLAYYLSTAMATDEPASDLPLVDPAPKFSRPAEQRAWLRAERANILALIAHPGIDPVRREALIGAISALLRSEGPGELAANLLTSVVASARSRGDRLVEGRTLVELGTLSGNLGDYDQSLVYFAQAAQSYRNLGDRRGEVDVLRATGLVHFQRGRYRLSSDAFEQAFPIYKELGDPEHTADALTFLGLNNHARGRNAASRGFYEQAISIYLENELHMSATTCLVAASQTAYALYEFAAVRPMLDHALDLVMEMAPRSITAANVLQEIGRQQLLVGEYEDATRLFDQAMPIYLETGYRLGEGNIYFERGRVARALGDTRTALEQLTKALDVFMEIRNPSAEEWAVHELARLHSVTGNFEPVEALLDRALRINVDAGYIVGEAEVRNSIAAFRTVIEGPETGLELYRAALDLAMRAEHPLEQARALEGMARCEAQLSLADSVEHLEAAVDLYERMRVVEHGPAAAFLAELTG